MSTTDTATVRPIPQVELAPASSHYREIGGVQHIYTFGNGYQASVIQGPTSYGGSRGMWEIAVLGSDGHITYDTPITDDVLGYLSDAEVATTLAAIAALPALPV